MTLPYFFDNVTVIYAPVPEVLDGATACGVLWQAAPGRFLLDVPDVARYLVEEGRRVTIQAAPGADPIAVIRHGRMMPLAALLYQRGIPALHAAAAAHPQHGAVLLAGDSGCGKSTLLMALLQRGWSLLADELAIVTHGAEAGFMVQPVATDIALWPRTLEQFGMETAGLLRADANRLLVSVPHGSGEPQPLRSIYLLGVHSEREIACIAPAGAARFGAMSALLYNSHVADAILPRAAYLQWAGALATTTPMKRLRRPRGSSWSVAELADLIEADPV